MNGIQHIITERVDDIPLLLEQMQRLELPTLIDHHFPAHGHWQGLSPGWVTTIWLSSMKLSCGICVTRTAGLSSRAG